MADVQVLYGESVAATTASSTTWVDVASISSGSFTANKKYLILANQVSKVNSASTETRVRLVRGTTPTVFTDASLAYEGVNAAMEHELSYMYMYTQPGTPETIKLQISNSSTSTVTNVLSQIIAINMDDLGTDGTDYFWNEDLVDYTMTSTPTAKAITSSFTPNGTDRWLFIGHMIYDVVTIVDEIGFELYDSVAGVLNKGWVEGEDATNDFKGFNLYWVGTPTNAARTLAVRPVEEAGSNVMLSSRVIAINLAKFAQSSSVFDATEVNPASSPSWTTLSTISPTPTNTGNWVVIAFVTNDINESAADIEHRLQINPSGGGLADSPNYGATAPGNDGQDPLDETPFTVFNLVSLSSGAARQINFDGRRVAGTTGRMEDNGLVAFSVALGSSAINLVVADAAVVTQVDAPVLTQVHNITVADAAVVTQTDAPNLTQVHNLIVADASVTTQADAPVLVQAYNLVVADAAVTTQTDAIALTQVHNLTVADTSVTTQVDALSLTQVHNLITADASVTPQVDALDLAQVYNLVIADASVVTQADAPNLTQVHNLTAADAFVTTQTDAVVLVQTHNITVEDTFVTTQVDALTLEVGSITLAVADASVDTQADALNLTQVHNLTVVDASVTTQTDAISLTQVHNLAVADAFVTTQTDTFNLTQVHNITVEDSYVTTQVDGVTLSVGGIALLVDDVFITTQTDDFGITQVHNLQVADGYVTTQTDEITLSSAIDLSIADAFVTTQTDTLGLTQVHNLTIADAYVITELDSVIMGGSDTLVVQDAFVAPVADNMYVLQFDGTVHDFQHTTLVFESRHKVLFEAVHDIEFESRHKALFEASNIVEFESKHRVNIT